MEDKLNVLAPEVVKVDELDKNNLRVVLEPFERGFGYTIGHSLRRIMLSYMPGAAITEAANRCFAYINRKAGSSPPKKPI